MTADQPARTPEEMRGEEQAARERAHALIGSEAVFMNDGGGRVFSAHALSALQDRLTANELAHAREVEALKAENMCDACGGTGRALSGSCACGGSGKMSDLAVAVRVSLQSEIAAHAASLAASIAYEKRAVRAEEEAKELHEKLSRSSYEAKVRLLRETQADLAALRARIEAAACGDDNETGERT